VTSEEIAAKLGLQDPEQFAIEQEWKRIDELAQNRLPRLGSPRKFLFRRTGRTTRVALAAAAAISDGVDVVIHASNHVRQQHLALQVQRICRQCDIPFEGKILGERRGHTRAVEFRDHP